MGYMPPTHTTGVNFRFIAFAFQPRRAKYDLGIMRADRVRYGQVVISHFMTTTHGLKIYATTWGKYMLRLTVAQ